MNTKTCKKCGWIYPITQPGMRCRVCGEPFDIVKCRVCGKIVSGDERVPKVNLCKPCHNAEERRHMVKYEEKRRQQFKDVYADWLARLAAVPKDHPTLSEEQWLDACRHFNGCAICGDETIDTRGFFVQFEEGGRYCDWNIIPMCAKCGSEYRMQPNPFKQAWLRDKTARASNHRECLPKIVDYLGGKLDDACRNAKLSEQDAK